MPMQKPGRWKCDAFTCTYGRRERALRPRHKHYEMEGAGDLTGRIDSRTKMNAQSPAGYRKSYRVAPSCLIQR